MNLLPVPKSNPNATIAIPVDPNAKETTSNIKKAFNNCAETTVVSARLLLDPRFSAIYQGIKAINEDTGTGDYGRGLGTGFGVLMIMASPVWGIIRLGIGGVGTIGGALGTIATGIAYIVEKALHSVAGKPLPSQAQKQREHLMQLFVDRLKLMLETLPYSEQQSLKHDPKVLVELGVIAVAFLSREAGKEHLKVGKDHLNLADLKDQNDTRKKYFSLLCEIKETIRSLNLSLEDIYAWNYLMEKLAKLSQDPDDASLDHYEKETLRWLNHHTAQLSQLLINDPIFKKIWKQEFPFLD